jgi:hypothetical protein
VPPVLHRQAEAGGHRWPREALPAAGRKAARNGEGDGTVDVQVVPSNCVQCGAITAKGGRLTPPEGGDGPLYTQV